MFFCKMHRMGRFAQVLADASSWSRSAPDDGVGELDLRCGLSASALRSAGAPPPRRW
jgi:hypothetical protein